MINFRATIRIERITIYNAITDLEIQGYSIYRIQDMSASHVTPLLEPLISATVDFESLTISEACKKLQDDGYNVTTITDESKEN